MPEDNQQPDEQSVPQPSQAPQDPESPQPQNNPTPLEPEQTPPPAPDSSPGKSKKAKLLVIIIAVLLLIGGGVTAFWLWQSDENGENGEEQAFSSDQADVGFTPAVSDEPAVLSELDRVFGEYVVAIHEDAILPISYEQTYYFYNDDGNFALSETEHGRIYQLDFHDSEEFRDSGWDCDPLQNRYSREISLLRSTFLDNGYEIADISPYRQDENCQDAFIAENDAVSCSAGFYLGSDVTRQTENFMGGPGGAELLTVSCKSRANLESDITATRLLHEAVTAAATYDFGPNEQLVGKPILLDAANPDHTIIMHQENAGNSYYYTYEGAWYRANFFDGIPCSIDGPDAEREREVFRGQECFDSESQTSSIVR